MRDAVAAQNPLGSNIEDDVVPAEFRAAPPDALTLGADPEQSNQISGSGRAPHVADEDRAWITIEDNDDIPPGGLFVGVNGVGYNILPGEKVHVPESVCAVLDNAMKAVPVLDPVTRRVMRWKEQKRFPYTRHMNG